MRWLVTCCTALAVTAALGGAPATAGPNCTCRYAGKDFELGQIMCIRGKLSRCEMFLNNTSWKVIAETCPEAKRTEPRDEEKKRIASSE